MKGVFVTGTGTGVGKTLVTGILAKALIDKGYRVVTQKWVQTGCGRGIPEDIQAHLKIVGRDASEISGYLEHICPYRFKLPSSPHLASRKEGKKISRSRIKKSFQILSRKFDLVIVEGTGGVLVPLDEKGFVIDIAKDLKLPVLIVAQNKLGAINQALLTIEAIKKRKMKILGIVFNNIKGENKEILKDNPRIIEKISGIKTLGILPWING